MSAPNLDTRAALVAEAALIEMDGMGLSFERGLEYAEKIAEEVQAFAEDRHYAERETVG